MTNMEEGGREASSETNENNPKDSRMKEETTTGETTEEDGTTDPVEAEMRDMEEEIRLEDPGKGMDLLPGERCLLLRNE